MKKFFFIIWGDPKFYQTLIFLSQMISSKKYKVYILARNLDHKKDIIKKINFGKNVTILKSPNLVSNFGNFLEYLIFLIYVSFQFVLKNPENVIFFNKKGLFTILLLKFLKYRTKFIYHNFDFDLPKNVRSFKEKILIKLEFFCSNFCKYLVFPSKDRAKIFKKNSGNKTSMFYSFLNCFPQKFKTSKSAKFKTYLKKRNLINKKIVCYLGSIGPDHYLNEVIKSFKYIEDKTVLIIAGNSINNYASFLRKQILINKFGNKIFIIEDVSNDYWFEIIKNSNLGLCFYNQINLSHKYMAGTSQKFNNYLFFNIPMLVNNNSDFKKFKKNYDIFDIVKYNNPKEISLSIKKLFKNNKRYMKIKKNMKKVFLNYLNFEKQYQDSYDKFL